MDKEQLKIMTTRLAIPREVIDTLKCHLCQGYLSVPPISTFEEKFACGRCNPRWPRNTLYEKLAQVAVFPCIYCEERFPWDLVQKHEYQCRQSILCPVNWKTNLQSTYTGQKSMAEYHKACQYRKITCPFEFCNSNYEVRNIREHFRKFHSDYIFTNTVEANKILKETKVWNFNPDTQVCLIYYKQTQFLLFIHSACWFDETNGDIISYDYFFSVFSLCQQKCDHEYSVGLVLNSDSETTTYYLENQNIKPFNENKHSTKYLSLGIFNSNRNIPFMTTRIEKLQKDHNLKLSYKIDISESIEAETEKPEYIALKQENYKKENFFINLEGLGKSFECPICKEYLCTPIYNCNTGHSFCRKCKDKLMECPYCKAIIGDSRNYVLENVLEVLEIFCQNESKGCQFMGKIPEVKLHELMCLYN